MSVPVGKRGKSSAQFVETASEIEAYAINVCKNWPKTYTFLLTNRTVALASEVYEYSMKANAIMPKTDEDVANRKALLQKALGSLYAFSAKIELAYRLFPICRQKDRMTVNEIDEKSAKIFERFMDLCETEEASLKGNISWTCSAVKK
jgi:hypothetical protein